MSPDALFVLCNAVVLPGWALLVLAPRWPWTQKLAGLLLPLGLSALYAAVAAPRLGGAVWAVVSLKGAQQAFADPWFLLAGWLHYLAFDLWVGAWEARDAQRRGLSRRAVAPCLLLTLLAGPLGYFTYVVLRTVRRPAPA
jgi:hypothetical protein